MHMKRQRKKVIKLRCVEFAVFHLQGILNAEFVYVASNSFLKNQN